MKKFISIVSLVVSIAIFGSCKKKAGNDPIIIKPPVILSKIDSETPSNAQPLVLGSDNNPITTVTTAMAPTGYKLDFSDEFNKTTLDNLKWNIAESATSRDARPSKGINEWYWKKEMVAFNGTDLILKASKFNASTMHCAAITSQGKYDQQYGFFETRIDNADIQKAVHTAFWLTSPNQGNVNNSGADGCEVDVFETAFTNGSRTQTALHWDGYGSTAKGWTQHWNNVGPFAADIHTGYHIFGFEWDATGMAIYYDGKKMFTYTGVGTPLVKEFILLSLGASFGDGDFLSRPLGELTTAKVDWIRVYTKK